MLAIILTVALLSCVESRQTRQIQSDRFCPRGTQPYAGGASVTCRTEGTICAAGFTCQRAATGNLNTLYCCSSQPMGSTTYCPNGGEPNYVSGGAATSQMVPQACSAAPCSSGYTCQRSSFGGLSYCCSTSSTRTSSLTYSDPSYNNGNGYNANSGYYSIVAYDPVYGYNTNSATNTNTGINYNTNTANNRGSTSTNSNVYYNANTATNNGNYNTNTAANGNGYNTAYTYNTAYIASNNTGSSNGGTPTLTASQVCPVGSTPWYYPGTYYVPTCTIGVSTCPYPSTCMSPGSSSSGARGYCCTRTVG